MRRQTQKPPAFGDLVVLPQYLRMMPQMPLSHQQGITVTAEQPFAAAVSSACVGNSGHARLTGLDIALMQTPLRY